MPRLSMSEGWLALRWRSASTCAVARLLTWEAHDVDAVKWDVAEALLGSYLGAGCTWG